jgi:nucleoside-diphosphate-sugar epimerase
VSKVESERVARELADQGAPLAIVNPGAVIGPHDPYLGESNAVLRDILTGRLPTWPRGSVQWVDVRDVAAVVTAALEHPGERFLVPGDNVTVPQHVLAEVTGRRLPAVVLPLAVVVPAVMPGYLTGWSFLPGALEGGRLVALNSTADASHTEATLGITGRPVRKSFSDAVRWMVDAGHVSAKQAGRVVSG